MRPSVLVLGGGPDREREVSLRSAQSVTEALRDADHTVRLETITTLDERALAALPGDVVFPALHGAWGEGGPMQDLLERSGRAYVGCGPGAARLAMDKMASKLAAVRAGVPTPPAALVNIDDARCPLPLPVVVKPVFDGSSVGLHICTTLEDWRVAHAADEPGQARLVERLVGGGGPRREFAVGVVDGRALPIVEIAPAEGVYDFAAKYERDDTRYEVEPSLPGDTGERLGRWAMEIAGSIGAEPLCRVDFMLDASDDAWFLEVNTMPGFTAQSLLPMAARAAEMSMASLCARLVEMALRRPARVNV
ncbi:MAG: D-alanine--D-alanine ligase [Planctomycetota bacterium]